MARKASVRRYSARCAAAASAQTGSPPRGHHAPAGRCNARADDRPPDPGRPRRRRRSSPSRPRACGGQHRAGDPGRPPAARRVGLGHRPGHGSNGAGPGLCGGRRRGTAPPWSSGIKRAARRCPEPWAILARPPVSVRVPKSVSEGAAPGPLRGRRCRICLYDNTSRPTGTRGSGPAAGTGPQPGVDAARAMAYLADGRISNPEAATGAVAHDPGLHPLPVHHRRNLALP